MELHDVVYGGGYNLHCVEGLGDGPGEIGRFGYDDNKPAGFMDCEVVAVEVENGSLSVTVHKD